MIFAKIYVTVGIALLFSCLGRVVWSLMTEMTKTDRWLVGSWLVWACTFVLALVWVG